MSPNLYICLIFIDFSVYNLYTKTKKGVFVYE